jgi:hypothetical protein
MSGADDAGPVADDALEVLNRARNALERDLLRILLQLDTESGEDSLVRGQGQTAAAVYRQIVQRLEQEGEYVVSAAGDAALASVEAVLGAPPANLSVDVRAELDQIVNGQAADVVKVFDQAQREMREAVARGVLSGGSLTDVVLDVQQALDTTYFKAQSAVDSAIMAVGRRAVMSEAAIVEEEGGIPLVYVYVGPRDQKNRPFCRQWVGKAVTKPSALDNGQGLDVEDYCGGYNCRHSWAPMLIREAVAQNYRIFDTTTKPPRDVTDELAQREQIAGEVTDGS